MLVNNLFHSLEPKKLKKKGFYKEKDCMENIKLHVKILSSGYDLNITLKGGIEIQLTDF